jgi:type IV pilus assembly protein PilA
MVELATTVTLVGVLSVLASYGVHVYVTHSKTAEATNTLGAIGRSVEMAFYRERMSADVLAQGASATTTTSGWVTGGGSKGKKGATVTHHPGLCGDAVPVPLSITSIQASKYQPNAALGQDYETGDDLTGWRCLHFVNDMPQYYQYQYLGGMSAGHVGVQLPHGGAPPGLKDQTLLWAAVARGDLNGNGVTSWFVLYGVIEGDTIRQAPSIGVLDEDE